MEKAIRNLSSNIDALRNFTNVVDPFLDEQALQVKESHSPVLKEFRILAEEFFQNNFPPEVVSSKDALINHLENEEIKIDKNLVINTFIRTGILKRVNASNVEIYKTELQKELLYKNSFISLITSCEWFLFQTLHQFFKAHPRSTGIDKKSLTFDDLERIGSIEDAQKFLIDSKVEEIMRGSFKDWIEFLEKNLKLKMDFLSKYKDEMVEAFQRRNILIHNGGIINSIYLSSISPELSKNLKLGDKITLSPEYIYRIIDLLEAVFLSIGFEIWEKLSPTDEDTIQNMHEIGFEKLLNNHYLASEAIFERISKLKKIPENDKTTAKINYWQSLKWQGRLSEVSNEISQTDFSAFRKIYKLCKYALTGDTKNSITLINELLKSNELSNRQLTEWPIFKEIRASQEFQIAFPHKNPT